jgi:hypothetical protein
MVKSHFGPVRLVPVDAHTRPAGQHRVLTGHGTAGQQEKESK